MEIIKSRISHFRKALKIVEKIFFKNTKKCLRVFVKSCIITTVVTLIAVKREVAAGHAGVPWSECQVRETGDKSLYKVKPSVKNRDDV